MKFSLLCLAAIGAVTTTEAFIIPTPRPTAAAVASSSSSKTQLQVAAEIVNGETKPRRTRQVGVEKVQQLFCDAKREMVCVFRQRWLTRYFFSIVCCTFVLGLTGTS